MISIREQAIKLLARREHSRYELRQKLQMRGWAAEETEALLDDLVANKLQDDDHFVEGYINYRKEAGIGPRRILAELKDRGIKNIPEVLLKEDDPDWLPFLKRVWEKKFKNIFPTDFKALNKQMQFLIYRGFSNDQIYFFLRKSNEIHD